MMAENAVVAKCFGANTISRNWNNVGDGVLTSCLLARSTMFGGVAAVCWAIWKSDNKACFGKKERKFTMVGKKNMSHLWDEIERCKSRRYQCESI